MTGNSKARRGFPALLVGVLAWAAPAFAQVVAEPTTSARQPWLLALDAREGWDSNVRFLEPGGPGDLVTRLDARLDRAWSGPRGNLLLSGSGQGFVYRTESDLNHFAYGADAAGSFLFSPRATIRLSESFRTTYASELGALTQAGLLLPPVVTRANTARGDFSYNVSRLTTVSFDLQHEIVSFDAPPLVPGSKITAGTAFSHELSRSDAVGAGYQFQRMIVEDEHSNTHTLDTRWTHAFGTSARARLRAGATRFQLLTAPAATRTTAVGGAGVDARWGRHAIDAQFDRYVDLAYGLGRVRINELVSARYSLLLTSDLGFDLRGVQGWGRDPADASFALTTTDVVAGLRYAFSRNLALAGSYTFRRISESSFLPVSSQGAALFLSYRQAWP
jgi:hypothetical protein